MKNIVKKLFIALPFRDPCGRWGHRDVDGTAFRCKDGKTAISGAQIYRSAAAKNAHFPTAQVFEQMGDRPRCGCGAILAFSKIQVPNSTYRARPNCW
jgi:hypothetical protein